ncbi:unnamed protein product [Aphanomyces euteiches]
MGLCLGSPEQKDRGTSSRSKHAKVSLSAFTSVLFSVDLCRAVVQFQAGVYIEERAILHGDTLRLNEDSFDDIDLKRVDGILTPWYNQRGIDRLALLVSESTRDPLRIVLLHAVYFGQVRVLEFLHQYTEIIYYTDPRRRYSGRSIDGRIQIVHSYDFFDLAAIRGNVPILEFLYRHRYQLSSPRAIQQAVMHGHVAVVEFLYTQTDATCPTRVMDLAAADGFLEIVQFLDKQDNIACTTQAVDHAAANGHLDVVQWLLEHRHEGGTAKAVATARANGHNHVVQYLEARNQPSKNVFLAVA